MRPVAQNAHASAQPTCELTHTEKRPVRSSGMRTVSNERPSAAARSSFTNGSSRLFCSVTSASAGTYANRRTASSATRRTPCTGSAIDSSRCTAATTRLASLTLDAQRERVAVSDGAGSRPGSADARVELPACSVLRCQMCLGSASASSRSWWSSRSSSWARRSCRRCSGSSASGPASSAAWPPTCARRAASTTRSAPKASPTTSARSASSRAASSTACRRPTSVSPR